MNGDEGGVKGAIWQLRPVLALMAAGSAVANGGLAYDLYVHEIVGLSAETESIYSPPHLMIFGGIALLSLGFLTIVHWFRRHTSTLLPAA